MRNTTHSPTSLAVCRANEVDDVYLKGKFNELTRSELEKRIARIQDPFLKEHAEKIARAIYVT